MEKWRFRQQSKKQMCYNILFCLGLVIASFIFLSVYSYFTSPFFKGDNGYDAGFFRLVGQGMTRGYLPYRDFFDMKGPYFFFIEYIGQLISYGRVGIFSLQIINLTLVLFLISKIYQLHGIHKRWLQFLLLIPILYVASFTLEGGNVTEEFSLVPLLFCLLLCLRHFASEQEVCKPYNGFCCGICFGYLALIKITHAALIGSIVLVVSIDLLLHRQSKNLLDNALAFIAGVILISLPMVIFYGVHGLLDEMYEAVWVLGFRYSGEESFLVHLQELIQGEKTQRLLLLIIPFGMGVIAKYPTWKERVILLAGSIFTILGISVGNNYTHYYAMSIPLIALAIGAAVRPTGGARDDVWIRKLVCAFLIFEMLFPQFVLVQEYTDRASELSKQKKFYINYDAILDYIPPEERDSVFSYGLNPSWYTYPDLFPCIKYCGWQNHYIDLIPEIAVEIQESFRTEPPQWLVLPVKESEMPEFMETEIKQNYQIVKVSSYWKLLERKGMQ